MFFGFNLRDEKKEEVDLPTFGPFSSAGEEPKLQDMLTDPMIHLVAKSDQIEPEQLAGCVEKMRQRIKRKDTVKH